MREETRLTLLDNVQNPMNGTIVKLSDGREFLVIPRDQLSNHQHNRFGWFVVAGLGVTVSLLLVASVLGSAFKPPAPVIVQPAPPPDVNPNCIAFCGG